MELMSANQSMDATTGGGFDALSNLLPFDSSAGAGGAVESYYASDAFSPLHVFPPGSDGPAAAGMAVRLPQPQPPLPPPPPVHESTTSMAVGNSVARSLGQPLPVPSTFEQSQSHSQPQQQGSDFITTPLMAKLFGAPPTEMSLDDCSAKASSPTVRKRRGASTSTTATDRAAPPKKARVSKSNARSAPPKALSSPGRSGSKLVPSLLGREQPGACSVGSGSSSLLGDEKTDLDAAGGVGSNKPAKKYRYRQVVASKIPHSSMDSTASTGSDPTVQSPQSVLETMLESRGYSTKTHSSFDCGYHSHPSPLQQASYGTAVLRAVQKSDVTALQSMLDAGLSRNPCNAHGDSVLHMVCKRGNHDVFKCLVESGACLTVADQFGRTPLHHAAWANDKVDLRSVELMLGREPDLLRITDKMGRTPLQYLSRNMWIKWTDFLESKAGLFFPQRGEGQKRDDEDGPPVASSRRGAATTTTTDDDDASSSSKLSESVLADPDDALPVDVATLVAAGKVEPKDAKKKTIAS